jgi:diaminohydroxyphosphoribosylaminopyrimidine deaminase / 5-amino-6-(5-phosphoribosylamino)uracil reductase
MKNYNLLEIDYMKLAIAQAKKAHNPSPNPKVGCIIIKNKKIISKGFHQKSGRNHAEINALQQAGKRAKSATLFATLEPCHHYGKTPPCSHAILKAGIRKVIIGMRDPNKCSRGGVEFLRKNGVEVKIGILEKKCVELNQIWLKNIHKKLPYLTLKLALDTHGNSIPPKRKKWITNSMSRRKVMHMRREHDAIAVGVNTIIADNPRLTVRGLKIEKQPTRLIFDPNGRVPKNAKVFQEQGETIIITKKSLRIAGAKNLVVKNYNLKTILRKLYELNICSIFLEGGEFTASKFLDAKLINRILIFQNKSKNVPRVCGKKLRLQKIGLFGEDSLYSLELNFQS